MKEVIQLRNHHLKQGKNNDKTPIYPVTKPEAILGLDKYLSKAGTGVVPFDSMPEEVVPGTIYYNTVEDKYYTSDASGALKPIESSGKDAYDIAVDNGFEGTEVEWLASLHGQDGQDGTNGVNGQDGTDGKSAYEIAVEEGFTGSKADWLASLIGSCAITGDGSNIIALIVNDLVTGGAGNILSAEMGKQLAIQSLVTKGTFADAYEKAKHYNYVFPWMLNDVDDNDNQITKMIWHVGDLKFIDAIGSTIVGDTYVMTSETNPAMMAICYNNGFAASPDHITAQEARAATGTAGQFNQSGVTHIDLRYFTGLVTNIWQLGNISGKKLTLPAKPNPIGVNAGLGAVVSDFTVIIPPEVTRLDPYFINNTSSGKNAKVICESDTPFAIEQSRGNWFGDMPIGEVTMYVPSSAITAYEEHSVFGKYEILPIEDYTE